MADLSEIDVFDEEVSRQLDFSVDQFNDPVSGIRLKGGVKAPELLYTETLGPELTKLPVETKILVPLHLLDMAHVYNRNAVPLCSVEEYLAGPELPDEMPVYIEIRSVEELDETFVFKLRKDQQAILVLSLGIDYHEYREMFHQLDYWGLSNQVLVRLVLNGEDCERLSLQAAAQIGGLFLDRLPAGLWIYTPEIEGMAFSLALSRNILQSAGVRRYKAEFVSCPGCGRTLYDLQGAVAKVKAAFAHLDNLKIAIMGCVVNGPGEMGDADYGYVGAGNGKVNLYKGRQMVRTAIPEEEAINALRELIEGE